jgi:hypothetical protein
MLWSRAQGEASSEAVLKLKPRGRMAQLVAHLIDIQGVTGSSPVTPTTPSYNRLTIAFGDTLGSVVLIDDPDRG